MTASDEPPHRNRNDQWPAKTDEPFTESLFGREGVRKVHYAVYSLVFLVVYTVTLVVYAALRTLGMLVQDAIGISQSLWGAQDPVAAADATLTSLFMDSFFHWGVLISAIVTALVVTGLIFYWNEIRYKRGEWLRTFL